METVKKKDGRKMTVILKGRLDTATAPELDREIKEDIDDIDELVFDFSGLDYVSSAGLRLLLALHKTFSKRDNGTFRIIGVDSTVSEVFDITGFSEILNYEVK